MVKDHFIQFPFECAANEDAASKIDFLQVCVAKDAFDEIS